MLNPKKIFYVIINDVFGNKLGLTDSMFCHRVDATLSNFPLFSVHNSTLSVEQVLMLRPPSKHGLYCIYGFWVFGLELFFPLRVLGLAFRLFFKGTV
jgi:hypothetical protein